ncbi:protein-L-isoaspartate O-methyltransferase [Paroceanicella profunda]|uniref:Protein-L-isoaspartate O-methyltransferase n=1 Tax=Paroceanicella profunda TaxID=2579971 RepID=A0A5B8FG27_9RHOB|nr:rRNA adenine N-6-methyltransferase family protein [Paroceanicella profunda]QDL90711.1 protein-L-isoaspartate O-methyltransferase [Paroceanicella profunda]
MTNFAAARTAMVDCQIRPSDVTLYPIIAAMLEVPREKFVPVDLRDVAYVGEHVTIAENRVLLDPRVFAKMLDAVNPGPDALVLDIAPGCGYSSAVLARLAAAVVAVEEDPDFARVAAAALSETGADTVMVENGPHVAGAAAQGPFDLVFINGGVEQVPQAIIDQVKPGGQIIAIFVDGPYGQCRVGTCGNASVAWRNVFDATAPVLLGFAKEQEFAF